MTRASRRKSKPSAPRKIEAAETEGANDNGNLMVNAPPGVKEGPSARLLRQMLRQAHAQASAAPVANDRFAWTDSQLRRLRRAEAKRDSEDKRARANAVAEIARLTAERDATIARMERDAHEAETQALAALRGDDVECGDRKPGEPPRPMIRRSGLDWLSRKGRIDARQNIAGQRYGSDYRSVEDVRLRSCLADQSYGGSGRETAQEAKEEAYERLRSARSSGLVGHSRMIALCDAICGEGRTIRQLTGDNEAEAQQTEASLLIALDLLATHYRIKD